MEIRRGPSKVTIIVSVFLVLAVLGAIGTFGYLWYQKTHAPTETSSSSSDSGSISLNGNDTQQAKTETISTALVIPKSTDKVGDTIKLSSLTITVPTSWRTVNGKNLLNTPVASVYATSTNDILTQLIMVPERQPTDPALATNNLSVYNVTSWLAQASQGTNGIVSPQMKQKYIANITNMGAGQAMDKSACDGGDGVFNTTLCKDMLKPKVIKTSDGLMKGVAFLSTQLASEPGYDPQVIIFLTGQAKDQQLVMYGAFHLLDNNSHTLSASNTDALKKAWESYTKGNVPSDTLTLYQHVIDAVQSIKIQVN